MHGNVADLPEWHLEALLWFQANEGKTFAARPFDVGIQVKVTELQRGIRKPAGTEYALSVLQTSSGTYADEAPVHSGDQWHYLYHQEGKAPEDIRDPEARPTNRGLIRCKEDRIPVGVVVPASTGGYTVLGLATVDRWDAGYFTLSGPVRIGNEPVAAGQDQPSVALVELPPVEFDPDAEEDGRRRLLAEVVRRQGQPRFRRLLLQAYENRCAITRFDVPEALEAAHILAYNGPDSNHPANGLLLRADLHDLFDLGLIAVETKDDTVVLAAKLETTEYEPLAGELLFMPADEQLRPSRMALDRHRMQSQVT